MWKKPFFLSILIVALGNAHSAFGAATVGYQTLFTAVNIGTLPVAQLEVIRDIGRLTGYLSKISSDTAQLPRVPDFNSTTVVALGYNKGNRYFAFSQSIEAVLAGDTVVIVVHIDSQRVDSTINIQPAFSVQMITISKTDKPVICREKSFATIVKKEYILQRRNEVPTASSGLFDLKGRYCSKTARRGMSIFVGAHGNKKTVKTR